MRTMIVGAIAFATSLMHAATEGEPAAAQVQVNRVCVCKVQPAGMRAKLWQSAVHAFKQADANKNGKLEKGEIDNLQQTAKEKLRQRDDGQGERGAIFQRFDTNNDNGLDADEMQALVSAVQDVEASHADDMGKDAKGGDDAAAAKKFSERSLETLALAADKDHDGKLSQEESQNLLQSIITSKTHQKFDSNNDGHLDDQEKEQAQAQLKAAFEDHAKQMVQRFDKNNDGKLDDKERQAARAAFQIPEISCACVVAVRSAEQPR